MIYIFKDSNKERRQKQEIPMALVCIPSVVVQNGRFKRETMCAYQTELQDLILGLGYAFLVRAETKTVTDNPGQRQ